MRKCSAKHSREYPQIVEIYKKRYEKMATLEYKAELISFAKSVLQDSIENLGWKELLDWEHRHLKYTREELPKPRAELPIQIIQQSKGRCGEFALLYNGLLLANSYKSRIVIDCSTLKDKSKKAAGDHVWVEIFINNRWVHVDPTEKRINQPLMYTNEWNKDVNLVYALTDKKIVNVTKTYGLN
ncbi:MAG: hypothetical protein C0193_01200 [Candidatus Bathyarchaeota archaeon]|nr:MAG: hypothetical protein C0193_01200 [Candidatus Bathyarchaeota archaeon]